MSEKVLLNEREEKIASRSVALYLHRVQDTLRKIWRKKKRRSRREERKKKKIQRIDFDIAHARAFVDTFQFSRIKKKQNRKAKLYWNNAINNDVDTLFETTDSLYLLRVARNFIKGNEFRARSI